MTEHLNALTPAEHERLSLLMEECGEVIQMIGKIMRHGYGSKHPDGKYDNRRELEAELGDLLCALNMLEQVGEVSVVNINEAFNKKALKVEKYLHHSAGPSPKLVRYSKLRE